MKRSVLAFVIAALVIITTIIWIINARFSSNLQEVLMILGIVLVTGFAVFFGVKRLKSAVRKEVPEDELSKKIMTKSSSLSFYISIYLWLAIMYFSDSIELENHSLIGMGIIGMSIVLFISWLVVKFFGLANE